MRKTLLFFVFCLLTWAVMSQNYQVGHKQYNFVDPARNRTIQTEVYYPATTAGNNVPFAAGQFPVLVFGHGFVMAWNSYEWLWDSLVPKGYIMAFPRTEGSISPNHSAFGEDLKFLNNFLLSEGSNPSSDFYQHILGTSAIMGHSMGGGSSFLAAANNTNLTTLVNFAAAETNPSAIAAAANVTVPSVLFYGVNDGVTPPVNHQIPMYQALASSCKTLIGIIGGGHCYFADYNFNCSFGEGTTNPQPTISREQQHEIVAQLLIPYLEFILKGNAAAEHIFYQRLNSMNTITFQRSCLMNYDVAITRFVTPNNGCGLNSNQIVSVVINNNGINPVSNIPVSLVFNNQPPIQEVYTGTINPNDSVIYTLSQTVNAGQPGATYSFVAYCSYPNDEYIYNDTISVTYTNTTVAFPLQVNFTGFNGSNLSTVFPGWKEAQGVVPSGNTSLWINRTGVGGTSNTTAKVNFYGSPIREWILGPGFLCGPYTKLSFDVALTAYNSTNAYANGMGTKDSLRIFYSTDCGTTWNRLTAFGKNTNFTNTLQNIEIDLSGFNGQGVTIAFQVFRETSSANDYDLHLDNILIKNYNPYDLVAENFVSPIQQACYANEPIEVTIKNNGINTVDFSVTPVTIKIQVSGPINQSLIYNFNTGTLASQALLNQLVGNIDLSLNGTYTITQKIIFTNDNDTTNNILSKTITVENPEVTIQGNTQICNGQSTTLTTATNVYGNVLLSQSNSTQVNIPDNNSTGVTSNITVSNINSNILASNAIKRVIIDSLIHPFVSDLKIDLIAPDNSSINLINRRGGSGDNFIGTILDPTASVAISSVTNTNAPFTGSYIPEGNFNTLTGPAVGTWKLKVSDLLSSDIGKLHKWTLVLEINNSIVSYSWNTGQTTPDITVTPAQNTTYTVTATDAKGCIAINQVNVVVNSLPVINLGLDTTICQTDYLTINAGNFSQYAWSNGQTTPNITIDGSSIGTGTYSYAVTVTDNNGCTATDEITVTVIICNNISNSEIEPVKLFPNPAQEKLYIENIPVNSTLIITNELGKQIYMRHNVTSSTLNLNLTNWATGLYIITIMNEQIKTYTFIKE